KKRVEDLERLASSSLSEERRASLHEDLGRRRLGLAHRGWFGGVVRAGCGRLDLPHRRDVLERERADILLPQSDRPFARSFLRGCGEKTGPVREEDLVARRIALVLLAVDLVACAGELRLRFTAFEEEGQKLGDRDDPPSLGRDLGRCRMKEFPRAKNRRVEG